MKEELIDLLMVKRKPIQFNYEVRKYHIEMDIKYTLNMEVG